MQLALEGPNGAYARGASVVDHGDGTYALEFGVTVAGRWILSVRINGQPLIEGGIAFHVAFGTLTAEEADITLNPALDARGAAECGTTTDLIIVGAGFEVNKRLMTGLEAISVVLTCHCMRFRVAPLYARERYDSIRGQNSLASSGCSSHCGFDQWDSRSENSHSRYRRRSGNFLVRLRCLWRRCDEVHRRRTS